VSDDVVDDNIVDDADAVHLDVDGDDEGDDKDFNNVNFCF